jgi:hypothetical protein
MQATMRLFHTHAAWCCVLLLAAAVNCQMEDEIVPIDTSLASIVRSDLNSTLPAVTNSSSTNGTIKLPPSASSPPPPFKPQVKADLQVQDIISTDSASPAPQLTVAQATVWNKPPPPPPSPPPAMKQCTWDGYSCQYFINYAWSIVRPLNMTLAGLGSQK